MKGPIKNSTRHLSFACYGSTTPNNKRSRYIRLRPSPIYGRNSDQPIWMQQFKYLPTVMQKKSSSFLKRLLLVNFYFQRIGCIVLSRFSVASTSRRHFRGRKISHFFGDLEKEEALLNKELIAMELPSAVVVLPMGVLFLFSGLIVNCIQALCYIILWPFSKRLYRKANRVVAELLWSELVWLVDWWAGVKIRIYAEPSTVQCMGKEHALVISNHRSDIDWLVGWILAQRSGCLGGALAVMKKSSKFLPVMGWSMWFSEYVFLERSWARDEARLESGLQRLKDFTQPFWLALFVEGTRFTNAKLLAAQEYAASKGLPVPRNVLIPRTKGFVSAVSNMRSFVPAIYDVTVAVPVDEASPTMLRLFKRQPSVLHVHIKRHLMNELPNTDDGVAQWCKDTFVAKDDLLDRHRSENTFGEELYQPIGRSVTPLLVTLTWSSLLAVSVYKLVRHLLSSRQGAIWLAVGIILTTLIMQVFIRFTQSEHSTPAKATPATARNGITEQPITKISASE